MTKAIRKKIFAIFADFQWFTKFFPMNALSQ